MVKSSKAKRKRISKSRSKQSVVVRVWILIFLGGILAGSVYLLRNPEIFTAFLSPKTVSPPKRKIPFPFQHPEIGKRTISVNLYFSHPESDFLVPEPRTIPWKEADVEDQMRVIVEELIKGSKGDLFQTIPSQAVVRSIRFEKNGLGIVNFSRELSQNHPGGTLAEMHTIYSIVNSLVLNIPPLKKVQILVEGKVLDTLKGHIDCRAPFEANPAIIKSG